MLPVCNTSQAHPHLRQLQSPFGFLNTQDVPDLREVHQDLIRVARRNAELRMLKSLLGRAEKIESETQKNEEQEEEGEDEYMKPKSVCSQLFRIKFLSTESGGTQVGIGSASQAKPQANRQMCNKNLNPVPSFPTQLPKIESGGFTTVTQPALVRSQRSKSQVEGKSGLDCFWCRKAGKWCGWCKSSDADSSVLRGRNSNKYNFRKQLFRRHSFQKKCELEEKPKHLRASSSMAVPLLAEEQISRGKINLSKVALTSIESRKGCGVKCAEILKKNKSVILGILQEKYLTRIAMRARMMTFEATGVVFKQGDVVHVHQVVRYDDSDVRTVVMAPPLYVVAQGSLHVYTQDGHGSEVQVASITVGGVIGEYSMILGGNRCCTVRAAVPCMLIEVMRSHISRAIYESIQDELEEKEAERARSRQEKKAKRLLPLKSEREENAAREKEQVSIGFKRDIEKKIFGVILSDAQREREWSTGGFSRKMRKEHQQLMFEFYAIKIQRAIAGMRARRALMQIKRGKLERLSAVIRIQRMFRGALQRARMKQNMAILTNQQSKGQGHAAAWTIQWLLRSRENKEEAELDLHERYVSEKYYNIIREHVRCRKLEIARKVLYAIKTGEIVGFVFRCVCADIGGAKIPAVAVERWACCMSVVKKKKTDESNSAWVLRQEKLKYAVEEAVAEWFDKTDAVRQIVSSWKYDVIGYRQCDVQRRAADTLWERFFPCVCRSSTLDSHSLSVAAPFPSVPYDADCCSNCTGES